MKILTLIVFVMFLGACGSAPTLTGDAKPKVGDTVVAKWAPGSFYEGKIEKIDGTKHTVAWLDRSAPTAVEAVDVYAMPAAGAKPDVKAGDTVLIKDGTGTIWSGAEVTSADGGAYKVKIGSTTSDVAGDKIIKISAATATELKAKAGATDFLLEAQKGKPEPPADFKPKKGDKVLAEWATNTWYSGKIDNISGSNIYVAWDDNTKPSAVNSGKVVPLPTADNGKEMPKPNQFILIKPETGSKWDYAQATTINGTSVEAKLVGNKSRTVKPGEFALLK